MVQGSPGAFPRVRILHDDAGKSLLSKVAKTICRAGMPFVPMWTFTKIEKEVVLEYLTNLQISKSRAAILESKVLATESTKMSLLLLRGLFAAGVLEFVFAKKRWRVSYGLDLTRSMLAVPYHAKDNVSSFGILISEILPHNPAADHQIFPAKRQVRVQSSGHSHRSYLSVVLLWRLE